MLIYPEIDPVIFEIGALKIRWYGMMYVVGFVAGWWLAKRRSTLPHSPVKPEQVDDLVFYVMLGVILGGRLGYTFIYGWADIAADPLYIFKIWKGGMSFHGGLAGVLLAMWLYGRKLGNTMWQMTDFIAPFVPIGLGTGRIGNFINGELWGKPTEVPWGFLYQGQVLHPSQLYEAILEGLVLFVVLWFYSAKPRPYMAVSAMFLLLYGVFRWFVEFYRVPDAHMGDNGYLAFGWLTTGHLLSVPMIIAGVIMLVMAYRRSKETAN
ncbi:MAG: prolipoprotein diacylglyceryl transferase [Woeseiaceae bacterium]|nr:prolipoprotein diacylglyceryl transferase [Woeseiaceae bacterium]